MSPFLVVVVFLILIVIAFAALLLVGSLRTRGSLARALTMSLFLVTVPRQAQNQQGNPKSEKELISVMEQLYASLSNLHSKGWNKFVYGEPYITVEMAVQHTGEEIHFYVAVPKTFEQIFEKQIFGLFPSAEVIKSQDYNIFNPTGATAGAYLTLKSNAILPFKTYQNLESDPLGTLATALSKLNRNNEGASLQILIRPSHRQDIRIFAQKVAREMQSGKDFNRAVFAAKGGPKAKSKDQLNQPPQSVTPFEEGVIKSLQAKSSKALFDCNVRILVSADDAGRANQILDDIAGGFAQFSGPDFNSFNITKLTGGPLDKLVFNFAFRIFDAAQSTVLSTEELTSLYHFPVSNAVARVKFISFKSSAAPANLPQAGVVLGENIFRGQKSLIRMTEEDRRRHLYIIGQTGTGKTNAMKAMVRQDIEQGKGVCVIDPHGDFAEFALAVVPKERVDDVIYFNPADTERPLGLNLLEIDPTQPQQKTFVTNEFYSIMKTIYRDLPEAFGPMFEQYYKNSVLLLLDDYAREIPTLAEIPRILSDEAYRKDKLSRETNPMVKNFWEQEAEKAGGEAALANMVPYITSKLNPFLANDYVRPIIAQRKSAFNFRQVMDEQKILIVNLAKGKIGDINANLLGLVIVSKLLMAAFSRDTADQNLKDLYLYIDEFQNFSTPSIATILSEARKYRLDLTLAHQFIQQLPDEIREAVFGNVGSMGIFRISPNDAENPAIKTRFEPVFNAQDLSNIANNNAYVSLLIHGQTNPPFNVRIQTEDVFGAGSSEVAEAVKEISRNKFGRPRDEVEAEINARYQARI